jgi:hypothetical protein
MSTRLSKRLVALLAPVLLLAIAGCGGGSSSGGSGSGTLSVVMSDGSDPSVTAVTVTIDRVEAHVNNTWMPITTVPQSFDLFDLVKNEKILGSATLPVGHYTQVRFFPSSATVTDNMGTHPCTIPSGMQTGVKVNVDYDIGPNQVTTILLDFNVEKSLIKEGNGQYRMQPVIPAVVKVLSGTITGTVTDGTNPLQGAVITATYTEGDSYTLGTNVNTSMSLADGSFKIWALLPGTYTLSVSYTDPNTSVTRTATRTGVVVTANQNTDVGTLVAQ